MLVVFNSTDEKRDLKPEKLAVHEKNIIAKTFFFMLKNFESLNDFANENFVNLSSSNSYLVIIIRPVISQHKFYSILKVFDFAGKNFHDLQKNSMLQVSNFEVLSTINILQV